MQLINTIPLKKYILFVLFSTTIITTLQAQENSPYSRYGLGDLMSNQNAINRAMGGISAAYHDRQSINFTNPASYSNLALVTYDFGIEIDSRTLKATNQNQKYTSNNLIPSYLQIGVPLRKNWGMVFGLRPVTRIQYNISTDTRLPGIDSLQTSYEGNGGLTEGYMGMGYKIGEFSFGANWGYAFGNRNIYTKLNFINDTIAYQQGKYADETHFGNIFYNAGIQYEHMFKNNLIVTMGISGSSEQNLRANRSLIQETYQYNSASGDIPIDTISLKNNIIGKIAVPLNYNIGFMVTKLTQDRNNNKVPQWAVGAEYNTTKWSQYRFYGQKDDVNDSWLLRIGSEVTPNALNAKSYWGRVAYRAGFYYGKDYVAVNAPINTYAVSFGFGLPIRRWSNYTNQFTQINTAFEIGKRGNSNNIISENFFKLTVGFCLSDIWFRRYKYD